MMVLLYLLLGSYVLFLIAALWGWRRISKQVNDIAQQERVITVLVPFRNEEKNIHHLVYSLSQLDYPSDKFEVILIDDHSEDNSYNVVKSLIYDKPTFNLKKLDENFIGKKMAICYGVELAKGEIIAITDADCTLPIEWLHQINNAFGDENVNMSFAGVRLKGPETFFSSLQAIEFTSLLGSAVSFLGYGVFVMGNGANMSFRKAAFQFVKGYEGNMSIASGDDEFLARKILSTFPNSINFIYSQEAVVTARTMSTLKDFVSQRIRWASKWKYNPSIMSRSVAVFVVAVQVAVIIAIIILLVQGYSEWGLMSLLMAKVLLEGTFLYRVSRFLKSGWSWLAFFVLQLIYPFYVLGIGIMSQVMPYKWKGRRLSGKM